MNRIKRIALSLLIAAGFGLSAVPLTAHAATPTQDACSALTNDSNNTCKSSSGSINLSNLVATIINILSFVVGVVAVIMIIIGGLKYVTSGGDSNSVTSAKNTLLYAIVGLVIVAMAQVIVRFVLNKVVPSKKSGYVTAQKQQVATVANRHYVLNYH